MESDVSHKQFLAEVAQDYYLSQLSITEIADKYNTSRYLVTKALKEAVTSRMVNIRINSPLARNVEIEATLKKMFQIPHVAVLRDADNPSQNSANIITYAAEQLQALIHQSHVVGLTWGETVYDVVDQFQSSVQDGLTFTQFVGENMKYNSLAGSTRMVEKAAAKFDARYTTIAAPLYIVNDTVRHALPKEPALTQTFATAARMDLLFSGLGTLSSIDAIPAWKQAKNQIFPKVDTHDIAGLLFGRPYNIHGEFLLPDKDTVLGVDLPTVLATPRRFAIIKSKFKTNAALGALRGQLLTDLVMDEGIAQRIIAAESEN